MTPARIKHYLAQGWKFEVKPYTDHHKGTDEVFYYAKSPLMRGKALICCPYRKGPYDSSRSDLPWEDMTEQELLKWEAKQRAHQTSCGDFSKQIEAEILKNPAAKEVTITVKLL